MNRSVRKDIEKSFLEFDYSPHEIVAIRAIRFKGVSSPRKLAETISNPSILEKASCEYFAVTINDKRPQGTHAYHIILDDNSSITYPIWR